MYINHYFLLLHNTKAFTTLLSLQFYVFLKPARVFRKNRGVPCTASDRVGKGSPHTPHALRHFTGPLEEARPVESLIKGLNHNIPVWLLAKCQIARKKK